MPYAMAGDVRLYYEEAGSGTPVLFVHEFAGDHRSWEPQMRGLSRRHRCITYGARGYPPSAVPEAAEAYSQTQAVDDAAAVLRHLGIERAHVVGLSMGGFAALHFGLLYPAMARSITVTGFGYGSDTTVREQFQADAAALAGRFESMGAAAVAEFYAASAGRVPFRQKDPRGWAEFKQQMAEHSAAGSARTMLNVQARRPSVYELEPALREMTVPTLLIAGDNDDMSLEPSLFVKRVVRTAVLWVFGNTGHTINLEEPDLFNRVVGDFIADVDAGRAPTRDLAAVGRSTLLGGAGRG